MEFPHTFTNTLTPAPFIDLFAKEQFLMSNQLETHFDLLWEGFERSRERWKRNCWRLQSFKRLCSFRKIENMHFVLGLIRLNFP